jgi:hypothetical protein
MSILKKILYFPKEIKRRLMSFIFLSQKPRSVLIFDNNINKKNSIDLITIAFNNHSLIKHQANSLKQFVTDNFIYHVVDNSTSKITSQLLFDFCNDNSINYYKLPSNFSKYPSISHSLALNWALHNILNKSKNIYYGFLDHDIFPIKETSIIRNLKNQPFYGHRQQREKIIYMWPGFCFMNRQIFNPIEINFLPNHFLGVDTGGRLFGKLKKLFNQKINWPRHSYIKINKRYNSVHESCIEKIDDWIHLINGSEWKKTHKKRLNQGLNYIKKIQNL